MPPSETNVWQRLLAVRRQIDGLAKDARNSGQNFKYVSSNNVLSTLRPLLNEQGLVLEVRILDHKLHSKWAGTDTSQKEHLTELTLEFVWVSADNPAERVVCPWYGQGLDTGEKGVGKALTYGEKYFMLKFFNIPTDEDDPDSGNGHQPQRSAPPSQPPTSQPRPPVPQTPASSSEPFDPFDNNDEGEPATPLSEFVGGPSDYAATMVARANAEITAGSVVQAHLDAAASLGALRSYLATNTDVKRTEQVLAVAKHFGVMSPATLGGMTQAQRLALIWAVEEGLR